MRNWNAPRPLALTGMVRLSAAIVVCILSGASAHAEWATFSDARGTAVQYPREVFPVPAGTGEPPGPMLQSLDGRARLHVFTLANERQHFLVFSAAEGDLILYRRCNFVAAAIRCFDVRYPRAEKRAWDERVTRMSFSLRPR